MSWGKMPSREWSASPRRRMAKRASASTSRRVFAARHASAWQLLHAVATLFANRWFMKPLQVSVAWKFRWRQCSLTAVVCHLTPAVADRLFGMRRHSRCQIRPCGSGRRAGSNRRKRSVGSPSSGTPRSAAACALTTKCTRSDRVLLLQYARTEAIPHRQARQRITHRDTQRSFVPAKWSDPTCCSNLCRLR